MKTKKILVLLLSAALVFSMLNGCTGEPSSVPSSGTDGAPVKITISSVDGGQYCLPFWIAEQTGKFAEANIDIEFIGFDGGPVQMEAYESWDIGITGVGGAISCLVGHDGMVVGVYGTDIAAQNFWTREDSDIVTAGQGHNTASPSIYGTADTWRGKTILCGYGDVHHYSLAKAMEGFGLTLNDVNVLWMDAAACFSSYLGGTGDVAAVYGPFNWMTERTEHSVMAVDSATMDFDVFGYLVGNTNSFADPVKATALEQVITIYAETADYMAQQITAGNEDEIVDYYEAYMNYIGSETPREILSAYLTAEKITSVADYKDLLAENADGNNRIVAGLVDVTEFFESCEIWPAGSAEKLAEPEHFNFSVVERLSNG